MKKKRVDLVGELMLQVEITGVEEVAIKIVVCNLLLLKEAWAEAVEEVEVEVEMETLKVEVQ